MCRKFSATSHIAKLLWLYVRAKVKPVYRSQPDVTRINAAQIFNTQSGFEGFEKIPPHPLKKIHCFLQLSKFILFHSWSILLRTVTHCPDTQLFPGSPLISLWQLHPPHSISCACSLLAKKEWRCQAREWQTSTIMSSGFSWIRAHSLHGPHTLLLWRYLAISATFLTRAELCQSCVLLVYHPGQVSLILQPIYTSDFNGHLKSIISKLPYWNLFFNPFALVNVHAFVHLGMWILWLNPLVCLYS